ADHDAVDAVGQRGLEVVQVRVVGQRLVGQDDQRVVVVVGELVLVFPDGVCVSQIELVAVDDQRPLGLSEVDRQRGAGGENEHEHRQNDETHADLPNNVLAATV